MSNSPIETKRAGAVKAVIWENQNDKGQIYHSIVISRSYRDDEGDWKETSQLFTDHLPLAQLVSNQAFAFIQERLEKLRSEKAASKKAEGNESGNTDPDSGQKQKQSHAEKVTAERAQRGTAKAK